MSPPCNVYIASSHNEELGGDGIPKALAYFKKHNLKFEVVLDEGGSRYQSAGWWHEL